jgi:hypothetical protein
MKRIKSEFITKYRKRFDKEAEGGA